MTDGGSLRDRLVDVGVELVLTEGSASVGLREIARRAGVSHGAPRRYFPTHHALLSAIAQRGFADLGARFQEAIAGSTSPRAQVQAIARAYVGYALERRGMFELMFRHDLLDSERHDSGERQLRGSSVPLFERVVAIVARCRAEQDAPAAVTAAALWANLHGLAQLWAWGSVQLILDATAGDGMDGVDGDEQLDRLLAAALEAHLGPVPA